MADLFDALHLEKEAILISYTDDNDEDVFPEYVKGFIVDDGILGHGIRINTGVGFTIKSEDAKRFGQWLIDAANLFIERGE